MIKKHENKKLAWNRKRRNEQKIKLDDKLKVLLSKIKTDGRKILVKSNK